MSAPPSPDPSPPAAKILATSMLHCMMDCDNDQDIVVLAKLTSTYAVYTIKLQQTPTYNTQQVLTLNDEHHVVDAGSSRVDS